MEVQILFEILLLYPFDIYLEVELLDHMVVLFLISLRKLHTTFHSSCGSCDGLVAKLCPTLCGPHGLQPSRLLCP